MAFYIFFILEILIQILIKLTPLTSLKVTVISSEFTSTWLESCILNMVPVNSTKNDWMI